MSIKRHWPMLPVAVLLLLSPLADMAPARQAQPVNAPSGAIVVQNFYFALPGKGDEVYRWRLHASEVRSRLGLPAGRVMRRLSGSGGEGESADLPDVVWECEYPSTQAREADVARLDKSPEFDAVQAHMQTLIRQFRRAVFSVAQAP